MNELQKLIEKYKEMLAPILINDDGTPMSEDDIESLILETLAYTIESAR